MKRYCFAFDLKDNPNLISEYKKHHENVWSAIIEGIKDSGIEKLDIYLVENRLFMIIDAPETFSLEKKEEIDANNPKVREWETLMWKFQQAIPGSGPNEKWRLMEHIFEL